MRKWEKDSGVPRPREGACPPTNTRSLVGRASGVACCGGSVLVNTRSLIGRASGSDRFAPLRPLPLLALRALSQVRFYLCASEQGGFFLDSARFRGSA